jgi:acyl-CoA synthetase (NDP forming)
LIHGTNPNAARRLIEGTTPGPASGTSPVEGHWLTGADSMQVLSTYGIRVVPTIYVDSPVSAITAARAEEQPEGAPGTWVLKAVGPAILHKTELGAVVLDIAPLDLAGAYRQLEAKLGDAMEGGIIQPMAPSGVETIAGVVRDPAFGPLVLFGAGGTAVELLDDSITRVAPLTEDDARTMVLGRKTSRLLSGYRGAPPVDSESLVDLVLRLGKLAEDLPEIAEIDCNPIIATPRGPFVVDARIRVAAALSPEEARHLP